MGVGKVIWWKGNIQSPFSPPFTDSLLLFSFRLDYDPWRGGQVSLTDVLRYRKWRWLSSPLGWVLCAGVDVWNTGR